MANAPAPKGWRNPAIVAAIIAAAVIVALIGLIPKPQTPLATPAHNVETSGGVAAGRNMHGNTITITGSDHLSGENISMANAPAPKGWRNPAIVAAVIAAVAAVIVALIGLIPKPQTPPATPAHNVETSGGVAAGRNMHGNTITITGSDQRTAPAKKPEGN